MIDVKPKAKILSQHLEQNKVTDEDGNDVNEDQTVKKTLIISQKRQPAEEVVHEGCVVVSSTGVAWRSVNGCKGYCLLASR